MVALIPPDEDAWDLGFIVSNVDRILFAEHGVLLTDRAGYFGVEDVQLIFANYVRVVAHVESVDD